MVSVKGWEGINMPDFTMCMKKECLKANSCLRVLVEPNQWQSYSRFENACNESNGYQMFMESYLNDKRTDTN